MSPFTLACSREILPFGMGFQSEDAVPAAVRHRKSAGEKNRKFEMLKGKVDSSSFAELLNASRGGVQSAGDKVERKRSDQLPMVYSLKQDFDRCPLTADKLRIEKEKKSFGRVSQQGLGSEKSSKRSKKGKQSPLSKKRNHSPTLGSVMGSSTTHEPSNFMEDKNFIDPEEDDRIYILGPHEN
eukprot:GDKJ01061262.1.p1 GENE.GDKJ01061262.1~~GDKJ01061262.1.p1  ORF type:complete len:183 (-),score=34.20 GDKJ01061262.1:107-655(-)